MRIYTVLSAILISLVGCGSGGGSSDNNSNPPTSTPSQSLTALEASGSIPNLERGTSIIGVDANNDGIRDDIEDYINRNYTVAAEVKSLRQTATIMQEALTVDTSDALAVKNTSRAMSRAVACTYKSFNSQSAKRPSVALQEIESITTNTKQRLLAYLAYNKSLDGTAGALPEGNNCD